MKPKKKFKWSFLVCREDNVRNNTIDDCKAAVDSAGLEYGLDEKKIENEIIKYALNELMFDDKFAITIYPDELAYALKLAERELIVRKKK